MCWIATSHSTAFVLISCNVTICMLNAAEIDTKCVSQRRKYGGRQVNPSLEWISWNVMHQNADSCLHRRWMSRSELLHSLSEMCEPPPLFCHQRELHQSAHVVPPPFPYPYNKPWLSLCQQLLERWRFRHLRPGRSPSTSYAFRLAYWSYVRDTNFSGPAETIKITLGERISKGIRIEVLDWNDQRNNRSAAQDAESTTAISYRNSRLQIRKKEISLITYCSHFGFPHNIVSDTVH